MSDGAALTPLRQSFPFHRCPAREASQCVLSEYHRDDHQFIRPDACDHRWQSGAHESGRYDECALCGTHRRRK